MEVKKALDILSTVGEVILRYDPFNQAWTCTMYKRPDQIFHITIGSDARYCLGDMVDYWVKRGELRL